jgi:protein-tyrosine phosphatase
MQIRSLMFKTDGAVYIHCFSGVGRTGMVVACLLGVLYGCTAEEALNHVNSCFRLRGELQTKPHKCCACLDMALAYSSIVPS